MGGQTLYKKVVVITSVYLGPAADRFIARHIVNHLNKNPEKLAKDDINELVNWIKPAMGILTEDSRLVDDYIDKIIELGERSGTKGHGEAEH
jgi:hypothetical protein